MYTLKTVPASVLDSFLSDIEEFEEHDCCIIGLRIGFIVETFTAMVSSPEFALMTGEKRRDLFKQHQKLNDLLEVVDRITTVHVCALIDKERIAVKA